MPNVHECLPHLSHIGPHHRPAAPCAVGGRAGVEPGGARASTLARGSGSSSRAASGSDLDAGRNRTVVLRPLTSRSVPTTTRAADVIGRQRGVLPIESIAEFNPGYRPRQASPEEPRLCW